MLVRPYEGHPAEQKQTRDFGRDDPLNKFAPAILAATIRWTNSHPRFWPRRPAEQKQTPDFGRDDPLDKNRHLFAPDMYPTNFPALG